jgi:GGDEF domain-containing protein
MVGAFSDDRSFAVAFIDIDHFKIFNNDHLETVVDQDAGRNCVRFSTDPPPTAADPISDS